MNEQKIQKLLMAARAENPPAPPEAFAADVLRAVRREPARAPLPAPTVFDQLNRLFPRLAWAAVLVIVLGIAVDYGLTAAGLPGVGDGVSQLSSQWLFTGTGL